MADIKARYVGHPDGTYILAVPVGDEGETRPVNIPYNGELPSEIDGLPVSAKFRDSLLQQSDSWTQVKRETKASKEADK